MISQDIQVDQDIRDLNGIINVIINLSLSCQDYILSIFYYLNQLTNQIYYYILYYDSFLDSKLLP